MPGRPCNASSIGVVIERSTSRGARPGTWVGTTTCSGALSGAAPNVGMRMSTTMRLPRAASTILLIMAASPLALVRNGGLHQCGLKPIAALADDRRPSREPARDLRFPVCDQAGMDRAPGEPAVSCRDKHDALLVDLLQATAWHQDGVAVL